MSAASPRRLDRALIALLVIGSAFWMAQAHWQDVELRWLDGKTALHERVLENQARDPYQYKLWLITEALEQIRVWTGTKLVEVFCVNTLLALLFLVLAHFAWLRSLVAPPVALLGSLLLAGLANTLFLIYEHHPYEFWGVGAFCLLLRGVQRDWDWRALAVLSFLMGVVWEKHALVALLWGLHAWSRGRPFGGTVLRGLVILAAALAVPLLVRWHLGSERGLVDGDTPLDAQDWAKVLWFQVPYLLPFVAILLLRFRRIPSWVRWLWLYLPVLAAAYLYKDYILHEPRSFWALAPVCTATFCCWLASLFPAPAAPEAAAPDVGGEGP
jgi:hypothetical protein